MVCILLSAFAVFPEYNHNAPNIVPEMPNFGRTSAVVTACIANTSYLKCPLATTKMENGSQPHGPQTATRTEQNILTGLTVIPSLSWFPCQRKPSPGICRSTGEQHRLFLADVGEESVIADLHEPLRQHMEQKTPDELQVKGVRSKRGQSKNNLRLFLL